MTEEERISLVDALKTIQKHCEKYRDNDCKGCWFRTIRCDCEFKDGWENLPYRNINNALGQRPLGEASYGKSYKIEKRSVVYKTETQIIYGCDSPIHSDSKISEFDFQNVSSDEIANWTFQKHKEE